jgi:hypothetical protein
VAVQFVKEQLTFTAEDSPMATLLLSVLGAFAEFERALIRERQLEGIALAKARGAYKGGKPSLTVGQAEALRARAAAGEPKAGLAREWPRDCCPTTTPSRWRPPGRWARADVIMLVGARLNWLLGHGEAPEWSPGAVFIQVDIDATELDSNQPIADNRTSHVLVV